MNKTIVSLAFLSASAAAPHAFAESELDLAVSSDVVAMDYRNRDEERGSQWGVGAMYNDPLSASLVSASFNVVGEADASGAVYTGLGLKLAVHDTFQTAASLALGGSLQYEPEEFMGLGLEGQIYYAPDILNTNDAEQFYELVARITYAIHPQAKVFVGWTDVNIEYDDSPFEDEEVEFEQNANLGFTLIF